MNVKNYYKHKILQRNFDKEKIENEKLETDRLEIERLKTEKNKWENVLKKETEKSTNQQIYGEIRSLMDDASKRYISQKAYEKRKEEYMKYMQEKRLIAEQQQQQKTDISNVIII